MDVRRSLDTLFTSLILLALPLTTAIAVAAPGDDEKQEPNVKREIVIKLKVDGEEFQITNLEELKKHADKLKDHVDIERLMKMFHGDDHPLGTGNQIHGPAHALDHFAGDHPIGDVAGAGHLHGAQDRQVDMAAADHSEGQRRIEIRGPG